MEQAVTWADWVPKAIAAGILPALIMAGVDSAHAAYYIMAGLAAVGASAVCARLASERRLEAELKEWRDVERDAIMLRIRQERLEAELEKQSERMTSLALDLRPLGDDAADDAAWSSRRAVVLRAADIGKEA
jgi:hypothetical protein